MGPVGQRTKLQKELKEITGLINLLVHCKHHQ
jgi:hypothetical protein